MRQFKRKAERKYAPLPLRPVNWSKRAKRGPAGVFGIEKYRKNWLPGIKPTLPRSIWHYKGAPWTFNFHSVTTRVNQDTTVAPGFSVAKFYANSYYDPLGDFGATKGNMHDIWTNVYRHYVVTAAKVIVELANEDDSNAVVACLVPVPNGDFDTVEAASVAKGAKSCLISSAGGSRSTATLSTPWIPMQNIKFRDLADESMSADFGASPTELCDVHLYMRPVVNVALAMNVRVLVHQKVTFSRPRDIEKVDIG